jgi:outer membrane protein OmpA-like peptidoglycan-associated protein
MMISYRSLSEKWSVARRARRPPGKERGPRPDAGVVALRRGGAGRSDAARGDGSRAAVGAFLRLAHRPCLQRRAPGRAFTSLIRSAAFLPVSAVLFLHGPAALGQSDPTFDIQNFRPGPSPLDILSTEQGETPGHLGFGAQLTLDYGHDLLVMKERSDGKWAETVHLVRHRLQADAGAVLGVMKFMQIGIRVPAVLYQGGDAAPDPRVDIGALESAAFGDIDLSFKITLPRRLKDVVGLGLAFSLGVPSGGKNRFAGDGMVAAAPAMILDFDLGVVALALNFGYRYRDGGEILDLEVGQELFINSGISVNIKSFCFLAQMQWRGSIGHLGSENHNPVEFTGAFRYVLAGHWVFTAGAGSSVTEGYGAPDLRVLASFGYVSRKAPTPGDSDGDGVPDASDKCPRDKEDADGFQDSDGCPDKDNDGDGIPDKKDKCPLEKEDADGFEDKDGCPDNDNDKDGLADGEDRCPDKAETVNGIEDGDGCPEADSDSDGLVDAADKCPGEAEDPDGFEDDDGCPDKDNDGDGIEDGKDGCPNEPETFNKIEDEDGCPDKARIMGCEIKIKEKVHFKSGSAEILPKSFDLLKEVAGILKANPQMGLLRIEGHTDSKGSDETNLKLSQQRAESVKAFLVKEGVDEKRLKAVGMGESKPIADNKTKEGKSLNRRVEFHIEQCEEKTEIIHQQ